MPIPPMARDLLLSKVVFQVVPLSVDFHTPPVAAPRNTVEGKFGSTAIAVTRPVDAGLPKFAPPAEFVTGWGPMLVHAAGSGQPKGGGTGASAGGSSPSARCCAIMESSCASEFCLAPGGVWAFGYAR